jgi:N-acetylneuraminic acid mutarotase
MIKIFSTISLILFVFYNASTQTWMQKANFPNGGRYHGVSFSIGNKGYIGLGINTSLVLFNDFWEWDQANNIWTQIANFPGIARSGASGFSIGKKGYVICGYGNSNATNEFWEWDGDISSPTYNVWSRKADFPGASRVKAVSFSIGKKGYVGTGSYTKDFWEWDGDTASPTYNTWTQKADFGGGYRGWATGFSCGLKAYIGLGTDGSNYRKDFWEWDGDITSVSYNTWSQIPDFPGDSRSNAMGTSIGNKGYVGLGLDNSTFINSNGFWEWDQISNLWTQKINFAGTGRQSVAAFTIGTKIYVGVGYDNGNANDFWEYCDTCTDVGIKESGLLQNVQVYPNPASDVIYMYNLPTDINATVTLSTITGQVVQSEKLSQNKINVSALNNGIYFLKIETKNGSAVKKVIVQR